MQTKAMQGAALGAVAERPLSRAACFTARPAPRRLVVKAQAERGSMSRREGGAALAAALASLGLAARPAAAGLLGFADPKEKEAEYTRLTNEVITDVKNALALPKDDPARPDAIQKVREETTAWVAKYRRDGTFQGRASYGNTYSALSALAGHYNNFGPETNVPKKRLDRLQKELSDAEKLLTRGR